MPIVSESGAVLSNGGDISNCGDKCGVFKVRVDALHLAAHSYVPLRVQNENAIKTILGLIINQLVIKKDSKSKERLTGC